MKKLVSLLVISSALFVGCGSDSSSKSSTSSKQDRQTLLISLAWDDLSSSDQQSVCEGIDLMGVDAAVDAFFEGAGTDSGISRSVVRDFFLDAC